MKLHMMLEAKNAICTHIYNWTRSVPNPKKRVKNELITNTKDRGDNSTIPVGYSGKNRIVAHKK